MSQSPFVVDLYAAARLDWCRSSYTPEGGEAAQLVCTDLARQCGSYTNATRSSGRIRHTAPLLQQLIGAPQINEWAGKCPVADISGVCNLGGAQRFRKALWQGLAQPREALIYEDINGRRPPRGLVNAAQQDGEEEAPDGAAAAGPADQTRIEIARGLPGETAFPNRAAAYAVAVQERRVLRSEQQLLGMPFL